MNISRTDFIGIILAASFLITDAAGAQNGFVWDSFKPDKGPTPVKVLVMGKCLNYYPLMKGDEILVALQGPARLRVLSRIEFGTEVGGEKSYYLRYQRDDGKKGRFRRVTTTSPTAVLADRATVHLGTSRSVYLTVPQGKYTYRFYVGSKAAYRLYLRFYERKSSVAATSENVAFSPSKFTQAVPLVIEEEEYTYYRLSAQDSIKLSIIGPTTVKVLARLEFDPSMFADQKFRIRVSEDGVAKDIHPLRSQPSDVAGYREMSGKVAGKGAKFFIEVPRGKHEYSFEILDNGRSILLRFFIPRKDLNNNL